MIILSNSMARLFFLGGTVVTFTIFLGLSWNTLSNDIPKTNHPDHITAQVVAGKHIWESNNCMGRHTILGKGAFYTLELTKVVKRSGEELIKTVLMSKTPWLTRGRKILTYRFSDKEETELLEFFKWIGKPDLNGFPLKLNIDNLMMKRLKQKFINF